MKRSLFLTVVCVTQLLFIVLYIHKSNLYTQQAYRAQELEHDKNKLLEQEQSLLHELYVAHNQDTLKEFAHKELGMVTLTIKHIKPLQCHE